MDLEFVEVEPSDTAGKEEEDDEEFAFPLFAGGAAEVMKVSLKEPEEEKIVNERPETYYRAVYSELDREQFASAAVTIEQIFTLPVVDAYPMKVMSIEEHNLAVEKERKRKRSRPGKKKRTNMIVCRERRLAREQEAKKHEKKLRDAMKRKMYKKPKTKRPEVGKPKYRTE